MTGINLNAPEWPVWQPISGGPDLPCVATNGSGEFIRCDHAGIWFRCDANGQPVEESPPGLLKLRVHLGYGVMLTMVAAPLAVYEIPGVGTAYRQITEIYEHPSGAVKVGDTWTLPDGETVVRHA